ncbi:MAG: DUF3857 domain-containing protein [Mucilaginibacter sp.]
MNKFIALLVLCIITLTAKAQTPDLKKDRPFGLVDTADLKMTTCDFEKGANAMVLFDKAEVNYNTAFSLIMLRHKRIKIFNDNGKDEASVHIEFLAHGDELVRDVEAETINLDGHIIEYTPVDKKLIYTQKIDKNTKEIVFTFPNVKAGSIIEYTYKWRTPYMNNYPSWSFQSTIPTRYSEFKEGPHGGLHAITKKGDMPFLKDTSFFINDKDHMAGSYHIRSMGNIHSIKEEPYMTPMEENVQMLISHGNMLSWDFIGSNLIKDEDFGKQLDVKLKNENEILAKVNSLNTPDEKISYLYNYVKNNIIWNGFNNVYTDDGVAKAWEKRKGNSAEINLILYHFLREAGLDVDPIIVSTKGKIDENYINTYKLNKPVDFVKIDSTKYYVLDASDKYSVYNALPFELLNSNGLYLDIDKNKTHFAEFQTFAPSKQIVFVNAQISSDGKMSGTTQINSFSYNRINAIKKYKTDGEQKFKDYLRNEDNNLTISSLKLENLEVDSLPLLQNIQFDLTLPGSDENYIYFNPNLFTGLYTNPFLSEERFSDIDFGCCNSYVIDGRYKIPAGYKTVAVPKNRTLVMGDKSINFKRLAEEEDGYIVVNYVINFKKSFFTKDAYPAIRTFYKKMLEMLEEQIILKKV